MMKNKIRAAALVAVPLAAALFLAGCADNGGSMPGMDHGGSDSSPSDSAADFNAADEMFATMMIPHHEQAVEMSDMILAKSDVDPRVLELAQQIKDAQQPEIDTMEGWLEDWGVDGMEPRGVLLAGGVSGHAAEINQLLFVGERTLSASSNRTVKVWKSQ